MWILAVRTLFRRWASGALVLLELMIGFFCLTIAVSTVLSATAVARRASAFAPLQARIVGTFRCDPAQVESGVSKLRQSFDVASFYVKGDKDIAIDHQTSELYRLAVTDGRWFQREDFSSGSGQVPAILGFRTRPELSVGRIIPGTNRVVVGRLRAGQLLTLPNLGVLESIVSTDQLVLTPANQEKRFHMARVVIFPNEGRTPALFDLPEEFSPCFNGTDTLQDELSAYYKSKRPVMMVTGFIALVIITIATLGFIGVALIIVEKRTREFAIRLTAGATKRQLMLQLLGEILLFSLLASLISTPAAYLAGKAINITVSAPVMILINAGGILLGILAASGPMVTMLQRPPVFFIRGGR